MSKSVEERLVKMSFDNKEFEAGAKQTTKTLEALNKALKMDSAADSLNSVNEAISETTGKTGALESLANSVETIAGRFTNLGVIATTALANITNKAIDAGMTLAKSIMLDPIMDGFAEYQLKMGSVQTILNSAKDDNGMAVTLADVNEQLAALNTYSDRTIYSFSDMTSNIGKFTNAGVSLNSSVDAIRGVSNVAAISGANANEASRAMYNFAQALSSGYVKLIDWKSIENANMATVDFKDQLLITASAMGVLEDNLDGTYTTMKGTTISATQNFNDSLQEAWMTTDVLTQTLKNYSNDVRDMTEAEIEEYEAKLRSIGYTEEQIQMIEELGSKAFDSAQEIKTYSQLIDTLTESVGSGWAETFELIFGNFEQAKYLWTGIDKLIEPFISLTGDVRNAILGNITTPLRDAIGQVLPADVIHMLGEFDSMVSRIGEAFAFDADTIRRMTDIFRTLLAPVSMLIELFSMLLYKVAEFTGIGVKWVTDGISSVIDFVGQLMSYLYPFEQCIDLIIRSIAQIDISSIFANSDVFHSLHFIEELTDVTKTGTTQLISFQNALHSVFTENGYLAQSLSGISPMLRDIYNTVAGPIVGAIDSAFTAFENFKEGLHGVVKSKEEFDEFGNSIGRVYERFGSYGRTIYEIIRTISSGIDRIKSAFKVGFNLETYFEKPINGFQNLSNSVYKIREALDGFVSSVVNLGTKVLNVFQPLIDRVKEFFGIFSPSGSGGGGGGVSEVSDGLSYVSEEFIDFSQTILHVIDAIANGLSHIVDFATGAVELISGIIDGLSPSKVIGNNDLLSWLGKTQKYLVTMFDTITNFDLAMTDFPEYAAKVAALFKSINPASAAAAFTTFWYNIFENVKNSILSIPWQDIGDLIMEYIMMAVEGVKMFASGVSEFMAAIPWEDIGESLKNGAIYIANALIDGIISLYDTVTSAISNLVNNLFKSGEEKALDAAKESVDNIVDGVTETATNGIGIAATSVSDAFRADASGLTDAVLGFFGIEKQNSSKLEQATAAVGSAIASGADEGGETAVEGLKDFGTNVSETAQSMFTGFGEKIIEVLTFIKDTITNAVKSIFSGIGSFFRDIKQPFAEAVGGFSDFVGNLLSGMSYTDLIMIVNTISMLFTAINTFNISKGFKNLTGSAGGLGEALKGFVGMLKGLKDFSPMTAIDKLTDSLKEMVTSVKPPKLLEIAVAIGILAGSIYLLSTIDDGGAAKAAAGVTGAVAILVVGFIGLFAALKQMIPELTKLGADIGAMGMAGAVLIEIAAAMLIMALVFKIMSSIPMDQFPQLILATMLAVAALAGLMAAMTLLSKEMTIDPSGLIKMAASMIILAVAISALMVPVLIMSLMPWEPLCMGLAKVFLMIAAIGIALDIVSLFANPKTMIQTAASLVILSGGLLTIAAALKLLSTIDADTLDNVTNRIGALFGELVVSITLLSMISREAATVSISLFLLSSAILVLAAACKVFETVGSGGFIGAAVGLGILVAALVVASSLITVAGPSIYGLALALNAVGKAALSIAGAILAVTVALAILTALAPLAASSLQIVLMTLISMIPMLMAELAAGLVMFIDVLLDSFPDMWDRIMTALLAAIVGLKELVGPLLDVLIQLLDAVAARAQEFAAKGTEVVVELLIGIFSKLGEYLGPVVESVLSFFSDVFSQAGEGIGVPLQPLIDGIIGILSTLGTYLAPVFDYLMGVLSLAAETIVGAIGTIADGFAKLIEAASGVIDTIGGVFIGIIEAVADVIRAIGESARSAGEGFGLFAEGCVTLSQIDLLGFAGSMGAISLALLDIAAMSGSIGAVGAGFTAIITAGTAGLAIFTGMSSAVALLTVGLNLLSSTASSAMGGVESAISQASTCFDQLPGTATTAMTATVAAFAVLSEASVVVTDVVTEIMNTFVITVGNRLEEAKSQFISFGSNVASAVRTHRNDMVIAGQYLVDGLIIGIRNKTNDVYWTGYELGRRTAEGVKKGAGENSPSKLTEQYGVWLGDGLIIGIESMYKAVTNSGYSMGEQAAESIADAVSTLSSFDDLMNEPPALTPVIDLSDTAKATNSINALFDSQSIRLNSAIDSSFIGTAGASIVGTLTEIQNTTENAMRELKEEVSNLRSDFDALMDMESEVAVYMDARKVASTTARAMDVQLGRLARRGGLA